MASEVKVAECEGKSTQCDTAWPWTGEPLGTLAELFAALPAMHKAEVYVPVVEPVRDAASDGNFDKFGGVPSVEADFGWPTCHHCGKDKTFFFQLTSPRDNRVTQMFHCACDDCADTSPTIRFFYAREIDVKNFTDEKRLELIKGSAYSHADAHGWEEYRATWWNARRGAAAPPPMQCFRVARWERRTELLPTNDLECLIEDWVARGRIGDKLLLAVWEEGRRHDHRAHGRAGEAPRPTPDECEAFLASVHKTEGWHSGFSTLLSELEHYATARAGVKFGGKGDSCQGIDYRKYDWHLRDAHYLPYMWGDAGYAHIDRDGKLDFDCC